MKNLFMLLSLLCCMTAVWAGTGDGSNGLNLPVNADGYIEVRTGAEFAAAIRVDNSAKIRLAVDSINIGGLGQICDTFSGEIVGGHEVFDPETGERRIAQHFLVGQRYEGMGTDSPLFNKLLEAHIENVGFMNIRVEDEDNEDLGVVARTAALTTFKNVTAAAVSVFCNHDNAGILVGIASDCTFEEVKIAASDITTDGISAGGIVGRSMSCNFNSCATNQHTHVFSDGRQGFLFSTNAACAGGISGYSMGDHFFDCVNWGWVGGDEDQVGGIVGTSTGSNFFLCVNHGIVLQTSEENFVKAIEGSLTGTVDYDSWKYPLKNIWVMLSETLFAGGMGVGGVMVFLSGDLLGVIGGVIFAVALVGLVTNVVTNMLMNAHDELGGIVGHAEDGIFEQCANEGHYNAVDKECGGIVGWGASLVINNCYSVRKPGGISHIADVEKLETNAAIIGYAEGCTITNNYAICTYRAIGKVKDMNPASGNNYYVSDSDVDETSVYEMRATTEQMKSGQLAYWLNNLHINELPNRWFNELHPDWKLTLHPWRQNLTGEKDANPMFDLTHDAVRIADITTLTHIADAAGLKAFAQRVNNGDQFACAVLDDDIDMSEVEGFTPIGLNKSYSQFRGLFDGLGHTIKGLKVNREGETGLFGSVHNCAIIRNVIIGDDCEFTSTGDAGAGGIVGAANINWKWGNAVIENCANYGKVTAPNHAGGIFGRFHFIDNNDNVHVKINNCYNMGTITASQGNSGLLCGYMRNSGVVSNCWSAGQLRTSKEGVKPYDDSHGQGHAEFFVGYLDKLDITNCYVIEKLENVDGTFMLTRQDGVEDHSAEALTSGALCYKLNNGVTDGTQTWYQKLKGEKGDAYPVRTKLTDGTNIVFRYKDANSITHYGNTSREEISDVILGITDFDDHRITDINQSGDVDVADVVQFNAAAIR